MRTRPLIAATLLAVLMASLAPGPSEAQGPRPVQLTRDALLNAPFKNACGGTQNGSLEDGRFWDPDEAWIQTVKVALGDLDGKLGRDGALVLRCTTDFLYPDEVALYTADRKGHPHFRGLVELDQLQGEVSGFTEPFALKIQRRHVTVRWIHTDHSWSDGYSVERPMTAKLAIKRGRAVVINVQAAGAPDVAATFAAAMLHRKWKVARSVATAEAVADLKGAPRSSFKAKPSCFLETVDDAESGVECVLHDASALLDYDEHHRRWTVTGGYIWN